LIERRKVMKTQKNIGIVKTFRVLWSVLIFFVVLLAAQLACATVIFEDNFDSSTLGPNWLISPGKGSYSLTDNPGYLRYTIDAYMTAREAGYDQYGNYYDKVLWLVCPFEGDQWLLKTAITYNLRPGQPTNNRSMNFTVREPEADGTWLAAITRMVGAYDDNPMSNSLALYSPENGISQTVATFPNSPDPLSPDRWYFEIERNGDNIAIRASDDGSDLTGGPITFQYQNSYTFPVGQLNDQQVIELEGCGWQGSNDPPGYADIDYIVIVPEPATICLFGLGGLVLMRKHRA
jgi:hypothetical protein